MSGRFRVNGWSSLALSLILVAANVGAPFRTSMLGRTFLDAQRHNFAASTRFVARATAHADVAHGFRAVVGLSDGGDGADAIDSGANSRPEPPLLLHPHLAFAFRQARLHAALPVCPLRC